MRFLAVFASLALHAVLLCSFSGTTSVPPRARQTPVEMDVRLQEPPKPPLPKGRGSGRGKVTKAATPVPPQPIEVTETPNAVIPVFAIAPLSTTPGLGSSGPPSNQRSTGTGDGTSRGTFSPAAVRAMPHVAYPREARENNIEGAVRFQVELDETGHVLSARLLSSPGYGLGEAAREALMRATFNPAMHDGQFVRASFEYVYRFQLE